ncbi:MAG: TlyA family rRNA (cytidine-2'-O)-methyltransferase [Herpetosiphon sp.]
MHGGDPVWLPDLLTTAIKGMAAPQKARLDTLLVDRELVETRSKAQSLILAGQVYVDGQKRTKAGEQVAIDARLDVRTGLPYVGRGGFKLAHALDRWQLPVQGRQAIDVGACTGGFTDVLLQRDAARIFAIDVGYGQLDYRLRTDARVVVLERTNIRYLDALPEQQRADCGVVDVSFISLRLVLPAMQRLITQAAWIVALIKPQFEAGADAVGKGGVVRDPHIHRQVLASTLSWCSEHNLALHGLLRSPITGAAGNVEFLAWIGGPGAVVDRAAAIEQALHEAN